MDYMKQNNCGCQPAPTPSICYDNYDALQDMPLAMSYVPWQQWQNVYDGAKGINNGTIFEELVFPFKCASPVCRSNGCGCHMPEPRTKGCNHVMPARNTMPVKHDRCMTPPSCMNQGNVKHSDCGCQHPQHNSCGRRCDV